MVYKPRSGRINLNTNEKFYTPEQKAYVLKICKEYINYFGYAKVEGKENPFAFFDYQNMTETDIQNNGAYEQLNADTYAWKIQNKEDVDQIKFEINKPA